MDQGSITCVLTKQSRDSALHVRMIGPYRCIKRGDTNVFMEAYLGPSNVVSYGRVLKVEEPRPVCVNNVTQSRPPPECGKMLQHSLIQHPQFCPCLNSSHHFLVNI